MQQTQTPSSSALVSGTLLATSMVGGLAFLASLAFWTLGWEQARAQAAFVFGLTAIPLGPLFLSKLSRIHGFLRNTKSRLVFLCLMALWIVSAGSAILGGPNGAHKAHPLVSLLIITIACTAFLFSPPNRHTRKNIRITAPPGLRPQWPQCTPSEYPIPPNTPTPTPRDA